MHSAAMQRQVGPHLRYAVNCLLAVAVSSGNILSHLLLSSNMCCMCACKSPLSQSIDCW